MPGPKFDYKPQWFERLTAHAASLLKLNIPVILTGDFNVIPTELNVYRPERWLHDALFRPEVRTAFQNLIEQGWTDAIQNLHPEEKIYTFRDYFRNAYGRNAGLRIDHFLLSPIFKVASWRQGSTIMFADGEKPVTMRQCGLRWLKSNYVL
ncbi:MAG: exodeoxyribonuclease [Adhaeribacter sp.]|nr:exodeoxyribonuclease [Adhaeribacter sp.]